LLLGRSIGFLMVPSLSGTPNFHGKNIALAPGGRIGSSLLYHTHIIDGILYSHVL
jgi:hypothetical protein